MQRKEAIESILEELLNCSAAHRRQLTHKILKNLPDTALFSIFQDLYGDRGIWDTCNCQMFEGTHRRDNRTGLCSRADLEPAV